MAFRFFDSFRKGLQLTRQKLAGAFSAVATIGRKVDEAFLEELEEALVMCDVGPRLAFEMVEDVRARFYAKELSRTEDITVFLHERMVARLTTKSLDLAHIADGPTVILMVGVNGTGKTTTTAKLAKRFASQGKTVLLGAADTFRAAAGEQLDIWAKRIGVDIIRHRDGADPAAVVFDACEAAVARHVDYLIVDTAGRLHTKDNLMRELEKIHRVAGNKIPGAPHEVLLVLDATTGQNALSQAKLFGQGVGVTGLVLAKLDGTAKGGIALAINRETDLPIKLVGTGEKEDDLADFDPASYTAALFDMTAS